MQPSTKRHTVLATGLILAVAVLILYGATVSVAAQVTATPARINLSTSTLPPTAQFRTETPTWTPTPMGLVVLEAITEANVRAEPDPESERLGTIRVGEIYPVLGRYFRWIQFQYDPSPSGKGWVFDELVTVTGDQSVIPDLAAQDAPTADPSLVAGTQALEVITLTPGGILTATANARVIPAPVASNNLIVPESTELALASISVLPTFTYPPNIATIETIGVAEAQPTAVQGSEATEINNDLPPIAPILVLGGLGLLGLIVSSMRR